MPKHDHESKVRSTRSAPVKRGTRTSDEIQQATAAHARDRMGSTDLLALQRLAGNAQVVQMLTAEPEQPPGPSPVLDVIGRGGSPLEPNLRAEMEERLGNDFSDVRVHTDAKAAASAQAIGAEAYTSGRDVVFGRGAFSPQSDAGKHTLAHELTHVVQQRKGAVDATPVGDGTALSHPSDRFEREAERTATEAMAGDRSVQRRSGGSGSASRPAGTGTPAVQRYSKASLASDQPIKWAQETTEVKRPDEGVSGGVYFMFSREGDLVAKPESAGAAGKHPWAKPTTDDEQKDEKAAARENTDKKARSGFAQLFLKKAMKIKTPDMRVVGRDGPGQEMEEFDSLKIAIRSKLKLKEGQAKPDTAFSNVRHFVIMSRAGGRSVSGTAKDAGEATMKARDGFELDPFIEQISNPVFMQNIGRLVTADAFIGNFDRLSRMKANLGNIMTKVNGKVAAIDQEANMKMRVGKAPKNTRALLEMDLSDITDLFSDDGRAAVFGSFIEGVTSYATSTGLWKDTLDLWLNDSVRARMRTEFDAGIRTGVADLTEAFQNSGLRKELQAQAQKHKSNYVQWDAYQVKERYFTLLARGVPAEQALTESAALATRLNKRFGS